jgi:hypothetical protein
LARSCRQGVVGAAPSNVIKGCAVWCGQPQDTCSGGSDVDERHHLFAPLSERRAPRAEAEDQQRLHHKPLRGIGGDIQGRSRGIPVLVRERGGLVGRLGAVARAPDGILRRK